MSGTLESSRGRGPGWNSQEPGKVSESGRNKGNWPAVETPTKNDKLRNRQKRYERPLIMDLCKKSFISGIDVRSPMETEGRTSRETSCAITWAHSR